MKFYFTFVTLNLFRELASHLCHLSTQPLEPCTLYTVSVSMEYAVPLHRGLGCSALVDFCIFFWQEDGIAIGIIPEV